MPAFVKDFPLPATSLNMFKAISRLIFLVSLLFLAVSFWTVTVGQLINYEFRNYKLASDFYYLILTGTPVAIMLTLFGILRYGQLKSKQLVYVGSTLGVAIFTFMFFVSKLFSIGFGLWTSYNIAYEHKSNPNRQVREQQYDLGALGYGGRRVVEVKPFAGIFWKISPIDTTNLNHREWTRVDKEADIVFP